MHGNFCSMNDLSYDELIEVQGIKLPLCKNIVTPRIERQMRLGNYEVGECAAARKFIRKGDRVLDLGAGIGLVASAVSKIEGVERIVSVEANPELLEVIQETHKINGIDTVELRHGIASRVAAEQVSILFAGSFLVFQYGAGFAPIQRSGSDDRFCHERFDRRDRPNRDHRRY